LPRGEGCMSVHQRVESERFRPFAYEEMIARGRDNLGIIWLKDESLVDAESVPPPAVIAVEFVEDLQSALKEFTAIAEALRS
jgi:type I restriction enzyme M protein